jgi:hypothetical protein
MALSVTGCRRMRARARARSHRGARCLCRFRRRCTPTLWKAVPGPVFSIEETRALKPGLQHPGPRPAAGVSRSASISRAAICERNTPLVARHSGQNCAAATEMIGPTRMAHKGLRPLITTKTAAPAAVLPRQASWGRLPAPSPIRSRGKARRQWE